VGLQRLPKVLKVQLTLTEVLGCRLPWPVIPASFLLPKKTGQTAENPELTGELSCRAGL